MIRKECLVNAENWVAPTKDEVKEVLKMAGFTGGQAGTFLGLQGKGRTVRRWSGGYATIPYAAWALLCEAAGLGCIWKIKTESGLIQPLSSAKGGSF